MDEPSQPPGVGPLIALIAGFAALGIPLVFVIWETINHLLTGDLAAVRWLDVAPAAVGLVGVLYAMARVLRRWA
jgi:ABC-type Mn2+/Zn2+ transport system permease subunit